MNKILDNWPAKVLCFIGAVALFYFQRMETLEHTYFSVPLELRLPEGFMPASEYNQRVRINLKGRGDSVYSILEEDIMAYVDLTTRTQEGRYKASVMVEKKGTALGVDPLEINVEPSEITLKMERQLRKSIEVFPSLSGYPARGYKLDQYYMSPSAVDVVGPASVVNTIRAVSTEEIDLTDKTEDFTQRVRLVKKNSFLQYPGGDIVEFRGLIEEANILKTVDNLEIIVSDLPPDLHVKGTLPQGMMQVQGLRQVLDNSESLFYGLVVDCSDITGPGTYVREIESFVPQGVLLLEYEPKTIRLEIVQRSGS